MLILHHHRRRNCSTLASFWCALVRTISLVILLSPECTFQQSPKLQNAEEDSLGTITATISVLTRCDKAVSPVQLYADLFSPSHPVCHSDDEIQVATLDLKNRRPKCTASEGCDIPLQCYNYTKSDLVLGTAQVVPVTPIELQSIVENENVSNNCVMVMFYAPWCEHCVQFARRYNTIGRMFRELPVLAVDLSVNDPHKYVLAYLPVVAFYHQARVIYRFKLTETLEELRDMITKMTDFPALDVSIEDGGSDGPVPVVRVREETPYLYVAIAWIAFVAMMFTVRTSRVSDCLNRLWIRVRAAG